MTTFRESCNLRTTASTSKLAPMASYKEKILRGNDDTAFYTTSRKPRDVAQERIVILEAVLELKDEKPPSHPKYRTKPAPDVPKTLPELLNHPCFFASIRQIAQLQARYIHAFKMKKALIKVAGDALSYTFQAGYKKAIDGFKNASF